MDSDMRNLMEKRIEDFDNMHKQLICLRHNLSILKGLNIEPAYETLDIKIENKTQCIYLGVYRKVYEPIKQILIKDLESRICCLENLQKSL